MEAWTATNDGWPLLLWPIKRQLEGRHGGSHRQPKVTQSAGTRLSAKAPAAQEDAQMKLRFTSRWRLVTQLLILPIFAKKILCRYTISNKFYSKKPKP